MRILLLLSILLCCSCQSHFTYQGYYTASKEGHIVISDIELGDNTIIDAVFDSGSSWSSVPMNLSTDSIGQNSAWVYHTDNVSHHTIYEATTIKLGNCTLPKKYNLHKSSIGDSLPAIIGCDIICDYFWLFDLKNKSYTLSNRQIPSDTLIVGRDFIKFNYITHKGFFETEFKRDSITASVLFDTGRTNKVIYEEHNIDIFFDLLNDKQNLLSFFDSYSIELEDKTTTVLSTARIGGVCFDDFAVHQNRDPRFDFLRKIGVDMVINMNFVNSFSYMYIDTKDKNVLLIK